MRQRNIVMQSVVDRVALLSFGIGLGAMLSHGEPLFVYIGFGVGILFGSIRLFLGPIEFEMFDNLPPKPNELESQLRDAIDKGMSLDEAIRHLHVQEENQLIFLWPAVASVAGISQSEAIHRVVFATSETATPP